MHATYPAKRDESMRHSRYCILLALPVLLAASPVRLIFDTDVGNDIDDALALAMVHAFQSRGEATLLAVTVTKDNPWAGPYLDIVNTFYGRPQIPVGTVRDGKTKDDGNYVRQIAASGVYPHQLKSGNDAPDAVKLLRQTLAAEEDGTVVIVQVGFSTNVARLLASTPDALTPLAGRELVKRKVRLVSMMGGDFASGDGRGAYNIVTDEPSARALFAECPVPIVASGYEIGERILYPAKSIQQDFGYVAHHPVAEAYRLYEHMPYDRPTWDLTSVLYAVRPGMFGVSEPGRITVLEKGRTAFIPDPKGLHRYLTANQAQRDQALALMTELVPAPPSHASQ